MTKHLPWLMETYHVMPWHLGGPEQLTFKELIAILDHFREKKRAEQRQARAQAGKGRGSAPGRRR